MAPNGNVSTIPLSSLREEIQDIGDIYFQTNICEGAGDNTIAYIVDPSTNITIDFRQSTPITFIGPSGERVSIFDFPGRQYTISGSIVFDVVGNPRPGVSFSLTIEILKGTRLGYQFGSRGTLPGELIINGGVYTSVETSSNIRVLLSDTQLNPGESIVLTPISGYIIITFI